MDYQKMRELVEGAIDIVDKRLDEDMSDGPSGDAWCRLDTLSFDQMFCQESDDKDGTMVCVKFAWHDPNVPKDEIGGYLMDEISLFEEDAKMESPYWIAGQIYAKILQKEKLF